MKKVFVLLIITFILISCNNTSLKTENPESTQINSHNINGTWKLVYSEIKEHDSITIKDTSTSEFIKIINETHFAFINQNSDNSEDFYAGAGTYTLNGNEYIEELTFLKSEAFRGHTFSFNLERKGDTLIQSGLEEVKEANIKRLIVEKYIKIEKIKL